MVSQSFSGVLLWDLLQSVGIVVNPNIKNDILRKTIVVTGSDGYKSVFTAGEIAPNFGGNQIMVAYLVDGQTAWYARADANCCAERQAGRPLRLDDRDDRS